MTHELLAMSSTQAAMNMRFEVSEFGGNYWFRLIGPDHELILSGGPQDDLDDCLDSIAALKVLCPTHAWFHARRSPSGAHYFTVEVGDTILATGHLYADRRERDVKMAAACRNIVDATVIMRGLRDNTSVDTGSVLLARLQRPAVNTPAASSSRPAAWPSPRG